MEDVRQSRQEFGNSCAVYHINTLGASFHAWRARSTSQFSVKKQVANGCVGRVPVQVHKISGTARVEEGILAVI